MQMNGQTWGWGVQTERGVKGRDTKKRDRDPGRGRQGPRARGIATQRGGRLEVGVRTETQR